MSRRLHIKLLGILLVLLLTTSSVLAAVSIDAEGQVPFYARAPRNGIIHDGEWAVIVFYRPASCIPADFNLLDFFDFPGPNGPGAFGCNPPTTDSKEVWKNGPGEDFAPLTANFHGLGAVPVWFVSWPELEAAIADDVLTIGELESLPSLLKGSATYYHEVIHPSSESPLPGPGNIHITARGELEGGGAFQVHVSLVDGAGGAVKIDFK
jgi:hypothetical protein